MRFRRVEDILTLIRENFRRHQVRHYFFPDDKGPDICSGSIDIFLDDKGLAESF